MADNSKNMWMEYSLIFYIFTSFITPLVVFNFLNVHLWNISFNPIDFILKPFMIIPVASLLLALFTEWTIHAFYYIKKLSLTIKKRDGRLSIKVLEKNLPIYIIDQNYFNEDVGIKSNTVVDMRIIDNDPLSFSDHLNVVKLSDYDNQLNIPYLIEQANLLIKNTALKRNPITFIVDSKKERNRTISKIWLRLMLNPHSKTAKDDIYTLLRLVY